MIKVSIIIPVYKVPLERLRACFESLVVQTMQECEFIVISDGASEAESSVCEEYAAKDSRFNFFRQEHAGVSAARNYGIEQAKGEYITFVDSDDKISDNFCLDIYKKMKEWNPDILLFEQIIENKKVNSVFSLYKRDVPLISTEQYRDLVTKLYCPQSNDGLILAGICCKAYRRLFINANNLRFQPELHYSEDQFFCLAAFLKTSRISYLANSSFYIQVCRFNSASSSYKIDYEKEICFYLELIGDVKNNHSGLISAGLFYNRTIQCILYTLDKCIFRPDNNISIKQRKSVFFSFLNNPYCRESLLKFNKNNFSLSERIACFLCKKKAFWILLLISKKWHVQRAIECYRNR